MRAPSPRRCRATSAARRVWTTTASAAARHRQSVQSSQRRRSWLATLCIVIARGTRRRTSGHSSASKRVEIRLCTWTTSGQARASRARRALTLPRYPALPSKQPSTSKRCGRSASSNFRLVRSETSTPAAASAAHRLNV
ncbi:MAG: hypothetical protein DME07_21995 [Candidatus Rokuibacteriota bacterium]|nr:MAG: hypothetical protein DME07_21995 [Candidatus Rokubacteria bacterium]